jgi:hypothetical protein
MVQSDVWLKQKAAAEHASSATEQSVASKWKKLWSEFRAGFRKHWGRFLYCTILMALFNFMCKFLSTLEKKVATTAHLLYRPIFC